MNTSEETLAGAVRTACRALTSNPLVSWVGTRRRRRGLVLVNLALLAVFPLLTWATDTVWPVGLLLLVVAVASVLLSGATGALFDRPLRVLDERERNLRRSFIAEPYFVGVPAGFLAGLVLAAVVVGPPHPALTGGAVALMMAPFLLPTAVVAWRLPTEVDDGA